MRILTFSIAEADHGMKIEHFLRREGISSRVIVKLRHMPPDQGILLNGEHARTIDLLSAGDTLNITLPQDPPKLKPSEIQVPILYEDEDVIVYNKPSGMPCHQSGGHFFDTLAHVYAAHCLETGEGGPFRPVNRIDRDTTGAVVAAKNQIAAGFLWKRVKKRYIALVEGNVEQDSGVIDLPIMPEEPYAMHRIVDPDGQEAITEFHVLERFGSHTLCEFMLHTGRTHQIRVHMSYKGHPLAGDDLYGGRQDIIGRQALHCLWVEFPCPASKKPLHIEAEMPEDMEKVIKKLRNGT